MVRLGCDFYSVSFCSILTDENVIPIYEDVILTYEILTLTYLEVFKSESMASNRCRIEVTTPQLHHW